MLSRYGLPQRSSLRSGTGRRLCHTPQHKRNPNRILVKQQRAWRASLVAHWGYLCVAWVGHSWGTVGAEVDAGRTAWCVRFQQGMRLVRIPCTFCHPSSGPGRTLLTCLAAEGEHSGSTAHNRTCAAWYATHAVLCAALTSWHGA